MNAFFTTLCIVWGIELVARCYYLLKGEAPERTFGTFAFDTVAVMGFFVWALFVWKGV